MWRLGKGCKKDKQGITCPRAGVQVMLGGPLHQQSDVFKQNWVTPGFPQAKHKDPRHIIAITRDS